jgi:hypothetical protein
VAIRLDDSKRAAIDAILPAIAAFRRAFGRDITPAFLGELYAARELALELADCSNEHGCDALDRAGRRYQIKYRNQSTGNVDVNNFDFDQLVLVNLDDAYVPTGMWSMPVDQAKAVFVHREKFRKYQVAQKTFKKLAAKLR